MSHNPTQTEVTQQEVTQDQTESTPAKEDNEFAGVAIVYVFLFMVFPIIAILAALYL